MASNKIAFITGGGRGLGKDMALSLAKKGIDIILTYNSNKTEADAVAAEIQKAGQRAAVLQLNTATASSFNNFVTSFTTILKDTFQATQFNYLINNAGIGLHANFADTTEAQFDEIMNIHLKGPFFLTQKLLPLLADGGVIINVSSGLARFTLPGSSAYAAMKGAIEVLTRYQAKELGSRGIRVNTIAPGAIQTDFGGGVVRDNADLNKMVAANTALGRAGVAEDIGAVVAFLCSDDARWVNAQRVEASGGMFL
ncbi:SDR family NAD(P)-dependent oxidoreductase [Chitinophaga sancti]|uniref:NAD(P)-dependent dehydrogenase, short-chain alcohol dehydrogenase family n=1 Tax=Chitinophaga sancti TaxID=1004 RepID=A0A1K1S6Q6_9BACT|nr:SDR family oxidoreductase [Chitinophaga sancti]WQD62209.1 SDR family oxidoreductase [Chitinophaga sancti]WQG92222.1 SDR family oxidoreductase [Chitinophaga sancti]SFW79898.1 NAD(P)-dependent dehydrogenase, short-chain alcohol dehydrogenase family [Chitinophaga sancti]